MLIPLTETIRELDRGATVTVALAANPPFRIAAGMPYGWPVKSVQDPVLVPRQTAITAFHRGGAGAVEFAVDPPLGYVVVTNIRGPVVAMRFSCEVPTVVTVGPLYGRAVLAVKGPICQAPLARSVGACREDGKNVGVTRRRARHSSILLTRDGHANRGAGGKGSGASRVRARGAGAMTVGACS